MEPVKNIVNGISNDKSGKTAGIISYFTLIGWLIAYFGFHQNNKTSLGSYQLRQTLLFYICYIVIRYGLSFILGAVWLSTGVVSLYYLLKIIDLMFFIMWLLGFIGAINGEKKPIPFVGERAQTIFSTI